MWQYLFRLRRVQLVLEEAWATLQALQHPTEGGSGGSAGQPPRLSGPLRVQLWQLRQRMAHFTENLQMYLQVSVG